MFQKIDTSNYICISKQFFGAVALTFMLAGCSGNYSESQEGWSIKFPPASVVPAYTGVVTDIKEPIIIRHRSFETVPYEKRSTGFAPDGREFKSVMSGTIGATNKGQNVLITTNFFTTKSYFGEQTEVEDLSSKIIVLTNDRGEVASVNIEGPETKKKEVTDSLKFAVIGLMAVFPKHGAIQGDDVFINDQARRLGMSKKGIVRGATSFRGRKSILVDLSFNFGKVKMKGYGLLDVATGATVYSNMAGSMVVHENGKKNVLTFAEIEELSLPLGSRWPNPDQAGHNFSTSQKSSNSSIYSKTPLKIITSFNDDEKITEMKGWVEYDGSLKKNVPLDLSIKTSAGKTVCKGTHKWSGFGANSNFSMTCFDPPLEIKGKFRVVGRQSEGQYKGKAVGTGVGQFDGGTIQFVYGLSSKEISKKPFTDLWVKYGGKTSELPKPYRNSFVNQWANSGGKASEGLKPPASIVKQPKRSVSLAPQAQFPKSSLNLRYIRSASKPDDIAVIIGNADYSKGRDIPNVNPAYADAEGIKNYVTQSLGIRDENIIFLKDATQAKMISTFGSKDNPKGQLFNYVKPGKSRVFVYYSGHGAPAGDDGNSYIVPTDAEASLIDLNGYSLKTLYKNLSKIPAKSMTVVLEACFSGASQDGTVISNASPIYLKAKETGVPSNITVIAAGAANQIASWEQDKSSGLFTKYFLKGMSGEADAKPYGNGDGKVGYDELDNYFKETLTYYARRYYGREQTAQIVVGQGR